MKTGTVNLVNAKDEIQRSEIYKSTEQWKRILDGWHTFYGDNMRFLFIQFCPDVYPTDTLLPPKKERRDFHKSPQLLLNERRSIRAVFK